MFSNVVLMPTVRWLMISRHCLQLDDVSSSLSGAQLTKKGVSMQYTFSRLATFIGASALLAACVAQPAAAPAGGSAPAAAAPNTISAIKVDAAGLDIAAAYWADAPTLTVPTIASVKGNPDGPDVSIQAVYDATSLALRLEWADSSEDIRSRVWVWDGSAFQRSPRMQDRMSVLFPIGNNAEFASKGCTVACHNMDADTAKWWMGSEDPNVFYDVWMWTAAATNPVKQAQDLIMNVQKDPDDHASARTADAAERTGSVSNSNTEPPGPKFMNADINATFIFTGEEVEIDVSKLVSGTMIPTSILRPAIGSIADVQANGTWQDGKWVVVLLRSLDTGHDDDVVLTPPKAYPLGVSVFDHFDHIDHTNAPEVLTLEWK
jgi:Ethylbenzene dehydrogenase